ncbi:hypothetical protein GCM10010174_80350 [Kutzneria viridogrisea]|uniref:EmrB/QacA subfamily drug resistance transporter n=1 Tax=Kutzneria viridogrisea TaxID=47990 RepID=A0ABR6BBC6_9PSEU|nr:EmrB/QacA subfamily drug resistance transporter [Kutzneria viridogrisea]
MTTTGAPPRSALWAVLGLVLLADVLDMIDSTVTSIAAPTIAAGLGGGEGLITWLGAGYALALGVLLVLGGRLGDRFGQRRLFLIGLAGFTIASAACGLAPDPVVLVAARVVQGAFGALLIPQGMAIMTKAFPPDLLRTAFGIYGPLVGIASVGGPLLGGVLIQADIAGLSWRPIFLINILLGTLGFLAAVRVLPHDRGDRGVVLDGLGAGLLGAAILGVLSGLVAGPASGWPVLPVLALVLGVLLLVLFALRQRRAANPLLEPSLFRHRGFTSGLLVGLVFFAASSGLVYVLSLFVQHVLHATALEAALGLLPLTIGIVVSSAAAMALVTRLGRTIVLLGLLVTLAGVGWLLLVTLDGTTITLPALAPITFVIGVGMGACFSTVFATALGGLAPGQAGSASGSLTAVQQIANGIGSALVTTVYLHSVAPGTPALATTLGVVFALTALCLPLVALLPRNRA